MARLRVGVILMAVGQVAIRITIMLGLLVGLISLSTHRLPALLLYILSFFLVLYILAQTPATLIGSTIKCPGCGRKILFSPSKFRWRLHPSCPSRGIIGPWGTQLLRAITSNKLACVLCGADYDLA
jgi:hypothetical protein